MCQGAIAVIGSGGTVSRIVAPVVDTSSIVAWLVSGARGARSPMDVLARLCADLVVGGVRLDRVRVFVQTLHPDIMGRAFSWRPGKEVEVFEAPTAILGSQTFIASPVTYVKANAAPLRRRLVDVARPRDFAVLDEIAAEGITDFLASPLIFSTGDIHVVTWATAAPGGFSDAEIAGIEAVVDPLARIAEIWALRRIATNLLDTYVGRQSGARVLAGQIRRGDTERIEAVIWLSDLRGFTPMADLLPPHELIARLNEFFDCQTPAIADRGGEVLKFMGDGLLAIFAVSAELSPQHACEAALAAADAAATALARKAGDLAYGLALHIGDVLYGNVGGGNRLDFTCIGPAVNMAARLEKLSGELRRPIVASAEFARHVPGAFESLGEFELKGFSTRRPVFGLVRKSADAPPAVAVP